MLGCYSSNVVFSWRQLFLNGYFMQKHRWSLLNSFEALPASVRWRITKNGCLLVGEGKVCTQTCPLPLGKMEVDTSKHISKHHVGDHCLRSSNQTMFHVCGFTKVRNIIISIKVFTVLTIWNSLSWEVQLILSLHSFHQHMKTFLFNKAIEKLCC